MKRHGIQGFFTVAAIKFMSLLLMVYVLFFLFYFGGLSEVGIYSAITAVSAPLAMFCSFRYVEWIALHENKEYGFSVSVVSGVLLYFLLAIPAFMILRNFVSDWLILLLLIAYKLIEMIGEFYITLLVSKGDIVGAGVSVCARFTLVLIFSILGLALGFESKLWVIVIALFASYTLVLLLIDMPKMLRMRYFVSFSIRDIYLYVVANFKYGLLGAMVSINSTFPRYFLTYVGDMKLLGLFSLVYQVAATVVNIAQYPVSVGISRIRIYLQGRYHLLQFASIVITVFVLALLGGSGLPALNQHNWLSNSFTGYLMLLFFAASMFVFLMFRGVIFSLAIALESARHLQWIVLIAGLLAAFILLSMWSVGFIASSFLMSCLFVVISSYLSVLMVVFGLRHSEVAA